VFHCGSKQHQPYGVCVCVCVCDNVQQYVHFTRHPSKFINPVAVAKTSGSCVDDALEKGMIL
jgi:hypothetical protein